MNADATAVSHPVDVVAPVGRPLQARDVGRRCCHPNCRTKLSRYNPDDTCNAHGGWSDDTVKRPGRKPSRPTRDAAVPTASGPAPAAATRPDPRPAAVAVLTAEAPAPTEEGAAASDLAAWSALDEPEVTNVVAELSLQPADDALGMPAILRQVVTLLSRTRLEVTPRPSGVIVSGDLSTIMDAVEQVHRVASRQSTQVVTSVQVIPQTRGD